MAHIERFAPSPTGYLHLGHAFSALTAWEAARSAGGTFHLRIEDIDHTRAKQEFEQAIYDDLHWLGISWATPVLRQSDNLPAYKAALEKLGALGLTYACICNRATIHAAVSEPLFGPDGQIYPGLCRSKNHPTIDNCNIRLNMEKAIGYLGETSVNKLFFNNTNEKTTLNHTQLLNGCGDVILARKTMGTSYHLSVVVDDSAQNITHVTRGKDLFEATSIHRILQALLGLTTPAYHHHRLILDENGKRLAKSDNSRAIRKYRDAGATLSDIRRMVGLGDR